MRYDKMKYIFSFGLIFALYLDGLLSLQLRLFTGTSFTESRLILLWLVMAICYSKLDLKYIFMWSAGIGLIFDIYYTGILGIYVILLPLLVYLTKFIIKFFTLSFIVILLVYLIDITLIASISYWINSLIGFASISVITFIGQTLEPTLFYNLVLFCLLFLPIQRVFEKFS